MVSQGGPVVNRFCKYRVGIIICSAECHGAVHVPAIGRVDSDTSAVITKLIQIVSSRVKHVGCARLSGSPTTLDGETGRASPGSLLYEPATDPRLRKELRIDVGGKPFERTHHQRGRVSDILGHLNTIPTGQLVPGRYGKIATKRRFAPKLLYVVEKVLASIDNARAVRPDEFARTKIG